ncbi:MAG: type IV pilin protein [Pseudomonadota bacterium]
MTSFNKGKGFTLIELMIVVVIVAILAGVAFPSYTQHVAKSRRADAKGALMGLAQAMERYYTENGTYADVGTTSVRDANNKPVIFAQEVPLDGGKKYYDLTIEAVTATSYTIQATPKNAQAGDGALILDSIGNKTWQHPDGTNRTCWDETCG